MIRIRIITLAWLLLATVPFSVQGNDNDGYIFSLHDCIDFALENNQNVEIASLEAEISAARVGETRA